MYEMKSSQKRIRRIQSECYPFRGRGIALRAKKQKERVPRFYWSTRPEARVSPEGYSFNEAGSERFFGDFLLRTAISSWAEGGTATAPLRTTSIASTFLP